MDEIYSNASGSVQFIEFQQPANPFDNEKFLTGVTLTESAFSHSFTFPSDLPGNTSANQHFLVATPGYAALSGVPAADYILPTNDWFSTAGDNVTYSFSLNTFSFTAAQLPIDGVNSLNRAYGSSSAAKAVNSPTNFAGQSGTIAVPEPGVLSLMACAAGAGMLRRRRRGL